MSEQTHTVSCIDRLLPKHHTTAAPRVPCPDTNTYTTTMDMDAEEGHTDVVASLITPCEICSKMAAEDSKLLTEYIVKLTKDHTLSSMIQEISSFAHNLNKRHAEKTHGQGVCGVHSDDTIARHVMFCIAPREASVRMIICNSVIMKLLNDAKSTQDSAIAVKLLLQTQAAEKKN